MRILENVHYIIHPLSKLWIGIIAVKSERLLLVDSATQSAIHRTILPYLSDHDLYKTDQSVLIVNTHCHCDHIGGNADLKAWLHANVAAHQEDAAYIENHITQLDDLYGSFANYKDLAMDRGSFLELAGSDTPVDRILIDGDKIDVGKMVFEVIHTPGHSMGSIVLYEPSLGLLLVGDAVQGNGTMDTEVPFITNLSIYRQSMRRLAELDVSMLIAAHSFKPYKYSIYRGSSAIRFIRESEDFANEYLDQVASLLSANNNPVKLLDLGIDLVKERGLARVNRYILILISACIDEMVLRGQAQRISGASWHPASTFINIS